MHHLDNACLLVRTEDYILLRYPALIILCFYIIGILLQKYVVYASLLYYLPTATNKRVEQLIGPSLNVCHRRRYISATTRLSSC